MNRRSFLIGVPLLAATTLIAKEELKYKVTMKGDLDDDLFIVRANKNNCIMESCYQMHNNIIKKFFYNNQVVPSEHVPGYIEYEKEHLIKNNDVVGIFTANEREALHSDKVLFKRTHYKSTSLSINNDEFFPELLPERSSVPNYPTWYNEDEAKEMGNYNYYHLWENSIINSGFIVKYSGTYNLYFFNAHDEIVYFAPTVFTKETRNVVFHKVNHLDNNNHPFLEVDGEVHSENFDFIKDNTITKIIISNPKIGTIEIPLPYPTPYVNRFFIKSLF